VSVLDGANAGRATTTDGNGFYNIGGLRASSFTLEAFKSGYATTDRAVTLMTDLRRRGTRGSRSAGPARATP
jgi:hypothetical protein